MGAAPGLTERTVQRSLFYWLRSASALLVPNYTPRGWYECDVLRITKRDYAHEYEIKLTVADFRADLTKKRKHGSLGEPRTVPRCFWYVMPRDLVDISGVEVPAYAGVIWIIQRPSPWPAKVTIAKPAPMLHRRKIDPKIAKHASEMIYWLE